MDKATTKKLSSVTPEQHKGIMSCLEILALFVTHVTLNLSHAFIKILVTTVTSSLGQVTPDDHITLVTTVTLSQWRRRDLAVMTYPKCGTTWSQAIVWMTMSNPCLDSLRASAALWDLKPLFE